MALLRVCALGVAFAFLAPAGRAEPTAQPADPPMPRVTVSFSGADLVEALFYVFQDTSLRFEAPKGTRDTFTADLRDVPLEKALRILLEPRGYAFRREGDLYRIARRDGYQPPGEKLRRETEERVRREEAERSRRPRYRERRQVRYLDALGLVSVTARPAGGSYSAYPLSLSNALVTSGRGRAGTSLEPTTRSLSLGALDIDLPRGLSLIPDGAWELGIPNEGETVISDGLGTRIIPFSGGGGLTIGRSR